MKSREKEQPGVLRDQAGKGGGPGPTLGRAPSCPHLLPDQGPLTMDKGEEDDDEEAWLQLRPVEPLPSQCCGSGCSPCVFDLYQRDLASWEAARASKDRSLLSGEETQSCPSKLSPETFLAFCISATDRLTKDTYLVRFALPGNSRLSLRPGQHLILRGIVDGLEIQRAYTPISPANAKGYFEVLIKCYQTGLMSQYVESWKAGDTAFWRGPFGGFFYKPNQYGELLMLAAGTGLAPMVPILQSITDNAEDETFITLVGCFKTFEGIYLKTFLREQARFWNVRTFFVLSQMRKLTLRGEGTSWCRAARQGEARIRTRDCLLPERQLSPTMVCCLPSTLWHPLLYGRGAWL
ncbi:NADH-cytochrome b5 reductase-like isoform X2 [Sagmatias obliquidens]|uniref:NADH-cytochrome b5 reductase-like isoform X2 n=1 Tax=Sagmatias obliquidens TaxID=3371155 RepID=UPI000F441B9E|nr:NADH-cytochrome b5 reductase-like isoform X2 [Lagenorhynchus obliquidens]